MSSGCLKVIDCPCGRFHQNLLPSVAFASARLAEAGTRRVIRDDLAPMASPRPASSDTGNCASLDRRVAPRVVRPGRLEPQFAAPGISHASSPLMAPISVNTQAVAVGYFDPRFRPDHPTSISGLVESDVVNITSC